MAIYHLSVKTVSRSAGRSAVAAVAYRVAQRLVDERTGQVHDYTRKGGVEARELVLPEGAPAWARDRAQLWNAAEQAETRKNSTVAREFEIALPAELSKAERRQLAMEFARELVKRHGFAADVAVHAPGKRGDHRNHHAHILCTTRRLTAAGFTEKTRELDQRSSHEVERWRARFAQLQNERLQVMGLEVRVDHRSLKAQGLERLPTRHLGPTACAIERRTGEPSRRRLDFEQEVAERLAQAKEQGELERQRQALERSILDLSGDLAAALAERDQMLAEKAQQVQELKQVAAEGVAAFKAQFEQFKEAQRGKQQVLEAYQRHQAEQARPSPAQERNPSPGKTTPERSIEPPQAERNRTVERQQEHAPQRTHGPSWSP
jgi:ATP-dependent exoDNAse (exonuclease V) alpha subunit